MLQIWQFQGVPALGMFLNGYAAGKRKVFEDPDLLRRWTPPALALGFGVGAPVSLASFVYSMVDTPPPALLPTLQVLINPLMTLGYIAVLIRLSRSAYAGAVAPLAPAGRMAASNYTGQSVVCMLIYSGYGLALAGKVPTAGIMAIATATFAAQVWLSARWLRRHAYGPVEWVLRAATNLSVPPWRTPADVEPESTDRRGGNRNLPDGPPPAEPATLRSMTSTRPPQEKPPPPPGTPPEHSAPTQPGPSTGRLVGVDLAQGMLQTALRAFAEHGIATEAWSPLAQGAVLNDGAIVRIAETHSVTSAQVVLRWHLQNGTIVIRKSVTPDRIRLNLDIFDFQLTEADMTALAGLDRDLRTGPDLDTLN